MITDIDLVEAEVALAFADCDPKCYDMEQAMKDRNLNFLASKSVSVSEAIEIMGRCCPSYNEFGPELLEFLPKDSRITIAREMSACVYVQPAILKEIKAMKADEWSTQGNLTRIWWD